MTNSRVGKLGLPTMIMGHYNSIKTSWFTVHHKSFDYIQCSISMPKLYLCSLNKHKVSFTSFFFNLQLSLVNLSTNIPYHTPVLNNYCMH